MPSAAITTTALPPATRPDAAAPRGLSFRQLLLIAFGLITLLLGAAALQALLALERGLLQSRETAQHAVQLTEGVQRLAERTLLMERSARQFVVLEDPGLQQRYQTAWQQALALHGTLAQALQPAPTAALADWAAQAEAVWDQLQRPARQRAATLARLTPMFVRLHAINDSLAAQSQRAVERRHNALLAGLDSQRRLISLLVIGAIVLAALSAFGFGHWLARPMLRIEAAIQRLGDNQFDQPVQVQGPADLRRLGQQLDWLRQRLAALESHKTRFVRHISHELKTPLAAIHEGVALLQDGVAGSLSPDQAEITAILRHNTNALQAQIEALLRYQAMAFEARQLHRRPVDLAALLLQVVESQRLQWMAKGLNVRVGGEALRASVDADSLQAALGNLLSNALQFSPVGGEIRLLLGTLPGQLRIDCIDQGPGVAADDAARIFDPFYQGRQQPSGARRGSGIGLAIVHEVARGHGGSVQLLPSAHGAHFRLQLPLYADDTVV